jgi:flagellar export protein FliJ
MTRHLTSLIRIQRWRVDAECRAVADRQAMADDLRLRLSALDHQLAHERQIADADATTAGAAYPAFAQAALQHRRELLAGLVKAEQALEQARAVLTEAYRQQRALELAQEARQQQQRREAQRRAQADLDEAATRQAGAGHRQAGL